jgi:hypothetical protein
MIGNFAKAILFVLICSLASVSYADIFITCRETGGSTASASLYREHAIDGITPSGWGDSNRIPTAVPAPPGGFKQSRFNTSTTLNGAFEFLLSNAVGFTAGSQYDIYLAQHVDNLDAANSIYKIYDSANPESSPIDSGIAVLGPAAGNTWYKVNSTPVTLGVGAAIKILENAPQGNRIYSNAVRLVELSAVSDWQLY